MKTAITVAGRLLFIALLFADPWPATGFEPPIDVAGPLEVRIEGPEVVGQTDTALPVRVVLRNRGGSPVEGMLQVGVIDRWKIEPAEPVAFRVAADAEAAYSFTATAGQGSYSAHYPIHACARFEHAGGEYIAHPILILQTRLTESPRAVVALPWKPVSLEPNSRLALWRMPVFRAVVSGFDGPTRVMPIGWTGSAPKNRGSVSVARETFDHQPREAVAMHPPWAGGEKGTVRCEYPVRLPETTPLRLEFYHAVQDEGQGDGVTFRVRVAPWDAPADAAGELVYEHHAKAVAWTPASVDLEPFAGQRVRVQLEAHPGPDRNTGWDRCFFGEPTLVSGTPSSEAEFPDDFSGDFRRLGVIEIESCRYEVCWLAGRRGVLDGIVAFVAEGDRAPLAFRGFEVQVLGSRIDDAASPTRLLEVVEEPTSGEGQLLMRHRFEHVQGRFDVVARLWVDDGGLHARFELDGEPAAQPWQVFRLEEVAPGGWNDELVQVYAGAGNVIRRPKAFELRFDGHRLSTSFVGVDFASGTSMVQAVDAAPLCFRCEPESREAALMAADEPTFTFLPSADVHDSVRRWRATNGRKAAGGVEKLAGRFVFDLWGGRYAQSAEQLQEAFDYGLTDAVVVWHNWQRWGYDYRLPEICPPNPRLGTLAEMQRLAQTCRRAGVLFAPHDNYIDFYPDAAGFSYDKHIAFRGPGAPVKAWLNEHRNARAYRWRADTLEPFLRHNLHLVRELLHPTAYFIDVWSSAPPYEYWTAAGKHFSRSYTRDVWGRQFAWIREFLGDDAPQISESGHDQLIGWLDGAQTNHLRVGRPMPGNRGWCVWDIECDDAERTIWFDVAHHDRFVLHGAGYGSRYVAGLDPRLHGMASDDYITTEVLTGHPSMVREPFSRDVVRKYWLTQDLMRALALETVEGVEFVDGDLHRQIVRWSNGTTVRVNRSDDDWSVDGVVLPPYGFFATVPAGQGEIAAMIARRDGLIVESSVGPEAVYVNGRRVVGGPLDIVLRTDEVRLEPTGRLRMKLHFDATDPLPADSDVFLHIVDDAGEIVFQASDPLGTLTEPRGGNFVVDAVAAVPESLKPGTTLELCWGLYRPKDGGGRLALAGRGDGQGRITLGELRFEGGGDRITAVEWKSAEQEPDGWLARQNMAGTPVDFGPLRTAGGCRLERVGDGLLLTPLPANKPRPLVVELAPDKLPWAVPAPKRWEALDAAGQTIDQGELSAVDGRLRLECQPAARRYRLVPGE